MLIDCSAQVFDVEHGLFESTRRQLISVVDLQI